MHGGKKGNGVHASSNDGVGHVYIKLLAMEGVVRHSQCVLEMHRRYIVRKGASQRIGGRWEREYHAIETAYKAAASALLLRAT